MGTAIITRAEPQNAPAHILTESVAPVVLTVQSLLRTRVELATALRNAQFDVRCVAAWDRLPEAVERIAADIVLVDMDVVDREAADSGRLSGHRLVTLLTRLLARRPTALVVMTRLDFAEVEDLARAGIHALISPQTGTRRLVQYIQAALERVRERYRRLSVCPVATVPVAVPAATSDGALPGVPGVPSMPVAQIAQILQRFTDGLAMKQIAAPPEEAATLASVASVNSMDGVNGVDGVASLDDMDAPPSTPQPRSKSRRTARASLSQRGDG